MTDSTDNEFFSQTLGEIAIEKIWNTYQVLITSLMTECREQAEKGLFSYSTTAVIPENVLRYLKDRFGLYSNKYDMTHGYSGVPGSLGKEITTTIYW